MSWYTSYYTELPGYIATWYAYYNPAFLSKIYKEDYAIFTIKLPFKKAYKNDLDIADLSETILEGLPEDFKKIVAELSCFVVKEKIVQPSSVSFLVDNVMITLSKTAQKITTINSLKFKSQNNIDTKHYGFGKIKLEQKTRRSLCNFDY